MVHYVTTNEGKVREAAEYLGDRVEMVDFDYTEVQADEPGPIAARGAREAFAYVGEPVIVDDTGLFIDALDGFPGPYSAYVEDTLGVERVGRIAREAAQTNAHENGNDGRVGNGTDDGDGTDDGNEDGDEAVARAGFRCVLAYCDGEPFAATPEPVDHGDRRGHDLAADDRDVASTTERVDEGCVGGDGGAAGGGVPVRLFEGWLPGRIVPPRGDGGFGYDPIFEHDGRTLAEMTTAEKNAISHRGRALAKFADFYDERTG